MKGGKQRRRCVSESSSGKRRRENTERINSGSARAQGVNLLSIIFCSFAMMLLDEATPMFTIGYKQEHHAAKALM